jgi:tetratricopeptide (TPR) repeat protein
MCYDDGIMRRIVRSVLLVIVLLAPVIVSSGCGRKVRHELYLSPGSLQNKKLERLFQLLEGEKSEEELFSILEQIVFIMRKENDLEGLNLFLSDFVQNHPEDPYLAYYLLTMGINYTEMEQTPLALYYFRRVLRETQDLYIGDKSIHLTCIRELILHSDDPDEIVECYEQILNRYPDEADPGYCYYQIATQYELTGHWTEAISYFSRFLENPGTEIPGKPDAHDQVRRKINYYYSDVSWAFDSIDTLMSNIRGAVESYNGGRLNSYKANYFFMMSWMQDTSDGYTHVPANLSSYLTKNTYLNAEIEPFSNNREVFIRSWGWAYQYQVGIWYLYFRRIDLPEKPEVNGSWEWAGIYLGERR